MKNLYKITVCFGLMLIMPAGIADTFSLHHFEIDGAYIGDSQSIFLQKMIRNYPATESKAKHTEPGSLILTRPVTCLTEKTGNIRCKGKFAEMEQPGSKQQKRFIEYRDVLAEFNPDRQLAFLSTITTTGHSDKKACLKSLSRFYKQAANKAVKPSSIYPRNQLDIYYIKIDEQPFTTRLLGKLDSAFSMVWQKARGDWSAFYSIDFGCRDNGYMVVNETLYDESRKSAANNGIQVSRLKTKD